MLNLDATEQIVEIPVTTACIIGNLVIPANAQGIVLFAHGSGSGRFSSRNRYVAEALQQAGLATLLIDLLTESEEKVDQNTQQYRFDIDLLARRLSKATQWLKQNKETRKLALGYFGASTGSAAALIAAARHPESVRSIVSRGGRPDLAGKALSWVQAPTLLLVGGEDKAVIALNRQADDQLTDSRHKSLVIIPGASHLFEESGTLEQVAQHAVQWFQQDLISAQ